MLSKWTGRGALWDILAVPEDPATDVDWTRERLRFRANRILLARLEPALEQWPTRLNHWLDLLPASRTHTRAARDFPFSGVSWVASAVRFGWPPSSFIGREAERGADMLIVTMLRWAIDTIVKVRRDAVQATPDADAKVRSQLDTAATLLERDPVCTAAAFQPGHPELTALRREGAPWGAVADVMAELISIETSPEALAFRLLLPDDEIRWRLFHLGVLGALLIELRNFGCHITSIRPLGAALMGPAFRVVDPHGEHWELWFEAAGIWTHHEIGSPYVEATRGLPRAARALGADLLLLQPGRKALALECKYSFNQDTVARDGYHQAMTYASELRSRLAEQVTSVVVGPEGVIEFPSFTETMVGRIGTTPPSGLMALVSRTMTRVALSATG